jgi:FKBP-type peptidyl-prolyl cis-trans isomerase
VKYLPKKLFTWILLGFAAYAYINYPTGNAPRTIKEKPAEDTVSVTPANKEAGISDNAVDKVIKKMSETDVGKAVVRTLAEDAYKKEHGDKVLSVVAAQQAGRVMTLDSLKGQSNAAVCGSNVSLSYKAFNDSNIKFDETDKPLSFKIGAGQVIRGLENGVVGMQKGGKRKIAIPSRLAYDDPKFKNDIVKGRPVLFEVDMVEVKDGFDANDIVEVQNLEVGTGDKEIFCGSGVSIEYKILENDTQVGGGKLEFNLGDGSVPIGLERGLVGMKVGSKSKILISEGQQKIRTTSILPQDFKFPNKGDMLVLEVSVMGISD